MAPLQSSAYLSKDRKYRYWLRRNWDQSAPSCLFVLLNPSKASETVNDPTVRLCIGYAKRWGYGGLVVGNLFVYRATDPSELKQVDDPVGPENDHQLSQLIIGAEQVICGWGNSGRFLDRDKAVLEMMREKARCLKFTKEGQPRHPRALGKHLRPVPYP